jgi:hypothetical protein
VDLMLRMFVRGSSVVPGSGMQQLAEQIAGRLPAGSIHLNLPVRKAAARRVSTDAGTVESRAVVVATDADSADELLGGALGRSEWKGVTTIYHAAPVAPLATPTLLLDTDDGPVNNTVVVTAAAPSYASDGRALVATRWCMVGRRRSTRTSCASGWPSFTTPRPASGSTSQRTTFPGAACDVGTA